jgi:biopolymer transport protein ExbD
MKLRVSDEDEPAMNLTPMVDVVFNLLVFFMLATTFAERERMLDLELPFASASNTRAPEPKELVVNVSREGGVWIDGRSLEGDDLVQVLSEAAARDARTMVTIRGDRRGYYNEIVHVLDACMQAGLENVSLGALTKD